MPLRASARLVLVRFGIVVGVGVWVWVRVRVGVRLG